jgi:polyhydroxybutyrate depolymerase
MSSRFGPLVVSLALGGGLSGCAGEGGSGASADETGATTTDADAGGDDATGDEVSDSGDSASTESGETGGETDTDADTDTDGGPSGSPGCGEAGPGSGVHADRPLDHDGLARTYDLFVPSDYDPDVPAPLVLNFHGLYGSPADQMEFSGFNDTAQARGIVVAYPAGVGESFNAGACCGDAAAQDVDDVGFSRSIVSAVSQELCIDPRRVYATGMSNGGHMAHTLACQAADVFAAVGPVAGVMGLDACAPARPVSVLDFHGTSDLIVPFGGAGPGFPPVDDMMQEWAARSGCGAASSPSLDAGDVHCETWPDCDDGVEITLCSVDGGGHCWPGNPVCLFGAANTDVDASAMIAEFFADHPLP